MGMSLYHMTEQYRAALAELSDADLPEEVVADTLEALEGELVQKGQAVAAFALNLGAEIEAIKAAVKQQEIASAERIAVLQAQLDRERRASEQMRGVR